MEIFIKRWIDLIVSSFLFLVLLPLIMLLTMLIYFKIGSPVLFMQQRPGKWGRPFTILKFRTMINKKDINGVLLADEDRLTKFGHLLRKYSLDELPQLINVIKGDISLVGPRPLLMEYLPHYTGEQFRRHNVKPGITGWAQVNGRNAISWEEKFELDVWYVDNNSLFLDLMIMWKTVTKVINSEGIQQEGYATMPVFEGEGKRDPI